MTFNVQRSTTSECLPEPSVAVGRRHLVFFKPGGGVLVTAHFAPEDGEQQRLRNDRAKSPAERDRPIVARRLEQEWHAVIGLAIGTMRFAPPVVRRNQKPGPVAQARLRNPASQL